MIPKIIHYCWFGKKPLPKLALKCIASWKKFLPDYEIKEWNEDNFDVNQIPYTSEAYACKKYAFVSDYARFKIMYEYGGIYFDTDVEVIKPLDDIILDDEIKLPYTKKELQNIGIGTSLINEIKKIAKEIKCDNINLSVWSFNENAIKFYKHIGFNTQKINMEITL